MSRIEEEESSLALRSPRSEPETEIMATARRLLGELQILRAYQTDPNDPSCAARIERLRETVTKEEHDERMRRRPRR